MRTRFAGIWFISFVLLGLVRAYTIDDGNSTVLQYSEIPGGSVWGPFGADTGEQLSILLPNGTMMPIDSTQCFDSTFTYAACTTANNCSVEFSFMGSGFAIYVLQAGPQGMSASLSIDSGPPTGATLDAPPPPQYYIPRVVLFDAQGFLSGSHSAVMTVLDWNSSFSGMMLDYIDVNETEVGTVNGSSLTGFGSVTGPGSQSGSGFQTGSVSASASASASASSSNGSVTSTLTSRITSTLTTSSGGGATSATASSTSSPSSPKNNVAALAGGAVGGMLGLIGLCALVLFVYLPRRRRRSRSRSRSQSRSRSFGENVGPLLYDRSSGSRLSNGGGGGGGGSQDVEDPFARGPSLTFVSGRGGQPVSILDRPSSAVTSEGNREVLGAGASAGMSVAEGSTGAIAASGGSMVSQPLPLVSAAASVGAAGIATSPAKGIVPVAATRTPPRLPACMADVAQVPVVNPVRGQVNQDDKTDGASAPVLEGEVSIPGITGDIGAWATGEAGARSGPGPGPGAEAGAGVGAGVVPRTGARSRQVLSDEQADFVAGLYQSNVPVPVVAHLLERMMVSPGGGGSGRFDENGETTVGTAPPSYDSVRAR